MCQVRSTLIVHAYSYWCVRSIRSDTLKIVKYHKIVAECLVAIITIIESDYRLSSIIQIPDYIL